MLTKFKVGMLIKCRKCDDLDFPFIGKIINILRTKLVVEILQINDQDSYKASLIQYNTVVEATNCVPIQFIRANKIKKHFK